MQLYYNNVNISNMKITSIQKVIKVGSSLAVTIPANDAKVAGLTAGSNVIMTAELVPRPDDSSPQKDLEIEYQAFKDQYGETLKNLADR